MQVKTILNRIQKHRGFVYGTVQLEEQMAGLALTVDIAPLRVRPAVGPARVLSLHYAPSSVRGAV